MTVRMIYAWSCDFNSNTGEGILSRHFCELFSKKENLIIKLKSPNIFAEIYDGKIFIKKKNKIFFNSKLMHYIHPFIGIFYLWINYFYGKKLIYLNYLPLWNFFIFLLLPPKTILGPITGGSRIQKKNFIRQNLFPIFYKISLFILNLRQKKIIFSTDLLKKFINKKIKKKCSFLFCLNFLEENKKIKFKKLKKFEVLFYYNNHPNKFNTQIIQLINKLVVYNIKIACIGERFPNKKVIYLGKVSRQKSWQIMKNSKMAFISSENYLSLFVLDCIACNLKLFVNSNEFMYLKRFISTKFLIKYNSLDPYQKLINLLLRNLKNFSHEFKTTSSKNNIKKINKLNRNYFSNLLDK